MPGSVARRVGDGASPCVRSLPGMTGFDAVAARLRNDRARAEERLHRLRAQFEDFVEAGELVATDDEHDPEGHTIAFERQQVVALVRETEVEIAELDAAQARCAAGTYGRCLACGGPISDARLDAVPAARHCITCAR
jgi:DnaK suppressor protein